MTIARKAEAWIKTKSGAHWIKEQELQQIEEALEEQAQSEVTR